MALEILAIRKDCFGETPRVRAGLAIAPEGACAPQIESRVQRSCGGCRGACVLFQNGA